MKPARFSHALAAALLLMPLPVLAATPGAIQAAESPTMPAPAGDRMGRGGKQAGKLGGFLTSEQRAMLMLDMRDKVKDMSPEQRKSFRKEQVSKIVALSPVDRQKFQADLQARWNALPAGQKGRIQQRLARQSAQ